MEDELTQNAWKTNFTSISALEDTPWAETFKKTNKRLIRIRVGNKGRQHQVFCKHSAQD